MLAYRNFAFLAILTLVLGGCSSFVPQTKPEAIGYTQEKIETAVRAIGRAYDRNLISYEMKNDLLDDAQVLLDGANAALIAYAEGLGDNSISTNLAEVRAFLRELVRTGILEEE